MVDEWVFLGALAAAYLVPGPDMLIVLRTGAASGATRAIAVAVGLALARAGHVAAAALGLATLLRSSPAAFAALRLVGALYLIWLGTEIARARDLAPADETVAPRPSSCGRAAARGFLTNITNPKALLFCSVLLPQFVAPAEVDPTSRFLTLGVTLVGTGAFFDLLFATVGTAARRPLARHPTAARFQRRLFAATLIGIGLHLAASAVI